MVTAEHIALLHNVRKRLEGCLLQLELVQSGLIVASQALHHQNADYDVDVARVLEYGVGDRLNVQLECIGELIVSLQSPSNSEDCAPRESERAPLQ